MSLPLTAVTIRISLAPLPGALTNRFQLCYFRLPPQVSLDLLRASDEDWGIARPARLFLEAYLPACDTTGDVDHFSHTIPSAISQIVDQPFWFPSPSQLLKSKDMGTREITDVYIIPNTSTIVRFIVSAVDGNAFPLSAGGLQHKRYEM